MPAVGKVIICYLDAFFKSTDTKPKIAPVATSDPPIVPASIPKTSKTTAQIKLDTNLDPIMQTTPMTI